MNGIEFMVMLALCVVERQGTVCIHRFCPQGVKLAVLGRCRWPFFLHMILHVYVYSSSFRGLTRARFVEVTFPNEVGCSGPIYSDMTFLRSPFCVYAVFAASGLALCTWCSRSALDGGFGAARNVPFGVVCVCVFSFITVRCYPTAFVTERCNVTGTCSGEY